MGIGLTTAIYSVVNAVLLRPLAYQHPDRMVWLTTQRPRAEPDANANGPEMMNSIDFATWQSESTSFAHMVAYDYSDSTLVAGGEASRIRIVVGVRGILGGERRAAAAWRVTDGAASRRSWPLTHRVFREQFQSDPQIIGRAVTMDGRQMTIGAVLPADFQPQLAGQQWWLTAGERRRCRRLPHAWRCSRHPA